MSDYFDPDAIRGDIESSLTQLFYPPVYSATKAYAAGDSVRLNGQVYMAAAPSIGAIPPSGGWSFQGPAYKLIYENVPSALESSGGIRLTISWADTRDESVMCPDGCLRSVTGVLTVWIFTPLNRGSSASLKTAMRLRESYLKWNRLGTCGKEVKISSINGPRSIAMPQGSDHYGQVVTATLTAMERVSYLR